MRIRKFPPQKSNYLGVQYDRWRNKWSVFVGIIRIGIYDTELEAAQAHDRIVKKKFGSKAKLNFPEK